MALAFALISIFSTTTPGDITSANKARDLRHLESIKRTTTHSNSKAPKAFPRCAGQATTVSTAALACLQAPPNVVAARPVTLKFHLDPTLHPSAAQRIRDIAAWALPYYNSYFTKLKRPASMHIVFSLSAEWCGQVVSRFDYGSPTPKQTEQSYLCVQDGGANAGHSRAKSSSFVVVRPPLDQREDFQFGTGESSDEFYYSLVAAEMGHASRSLMMEAYTGERGGQPYWPIWAQYMGNELLRYLADLETGTSVEDARADRIWWMCERRPTWGADYNDKRLNSWETGSGGIYGCPGGPGDQSNVDIPNHYNMSFMAGEYLVANHGLRWLFETFMSAPLKTRSGLGVRNLKKAARSLGYLRWRQIEVELNENMRAVLAEYGAVLPE